MALRRNKYYILILYIKSRVVSLLRLSAVHDQRVPRVGNCLLLFARGWGIDRQEKKKWQIRGVLPGGGWLQVDKTIHERIENKYTVLE